MKKLWTILLVLCLAGCRAQSYRGPQVQSVLKTETESQSDTDVIAMLETIDTDSTAEQVALAFSELINRTAREYEDGLEIHSIAYDQLPEIRDSLIVQNSYQVNTIYSSWISQGSLYQVARYESTDGDDYHGDIQLSRVSTKKTIDVLCTLASPALFSEALPKLTISRISETPVQIEGDYDGKRLEQMLIHRQMQYISGALGEYFSISPQSDPALFRFSLTPDENGYIFSIELAQLSQYNAAASESMKKRLETLLDGSGVASDYRTEKIWTDIYLNEDGVIEKIYSTIQESFQYASERFDVLEEQKLFIHEVPSTQSLPFILDFFSSIEQQSLQVGSSFILRVPISTTS